MMTIGPTFHAELAAAGLADVVKTWTSDGVIGRESLTPQQNAALDAVIAAHDPAAVTPDDPRDVALKADAQVVALAARLASMTPAQIDDWFTANVTNAAQAITALKAVVKILALKLR